MSTCAGSLQPFRSSNCTPSVVSGDDIFCLICSLSCVSSLRAYDGLWSLSSSVVQQIRGLQQPRGDVRAAGSVQMLCTASAASF